MSGETEQSVSGWTVDTLKEYVEARFLAGDQRVALALDAAKEAVGKAEFAAEKRFDAVNEFRGQLNDQAQTFMPRKESELQHQALVEKVAALTQIVNDRTARGAGATQAWGYLVGALGILAALATIIIATR